jgi:ureidoglycolate hydrolase
MSEATQVERVRVSVQPLTEEAFRPYGSVITMNSPAFPEVDEGQPMLKMTRLRPGHRDRNIVQMATHFSYSQSYIPVLGTMVLVLAPPPDDPETPRDRLKPDYDQVAAFAIPAGQAVLIARGTWHNLLQLEGESVFISGTRKGTHEIFSDGELVSGRLTPEQLEAYEKYARHIEIIDLDRVIEVVG